MKNSGEQGKLYTRAQIIEKFDLTPGKIKIWEKEGLFSTTVTKGDLGTHYYNEDTVKRINLVRIYSQLGYSLEEIGRIINKPGVSTNDLIAAQSERLREQVQKVERMLLTNDYILRYGIEFLEPEVFDDSDTTMFAGERNEYRKECMEKHMTRMLKNKADGFETILSGIFGKFEAFSADDKDPQSDEVKSVVADFKTMVDLIFPYNTSFRKSNEFLRFVRTNEQARTKYSKVISEEGFRYTHDAIWMYFLDEFDEQIYTQLDSNLFGLLTENHGEYDEEDVYRQTSYMYRDFWLEAHRIFDVTDIESLTGLTWPIFFSVQPDGVPEKRPSDKGASPMERVYWDARRYYKEHEKELKLEFLRYDDSLYMIPGEGGKHHEKG